MFERVRTDPSYEETRFVIEEAVEDDDGWDKWQRGEVDAIGDMSVYAGETQD